MSRPLGLLECWVRGRRSRGVCLRLRVAGKSIEESGALPRKKFLSAFLFFLELRMLRSRRHVEHREAAPPTPTPDSGLCQPCRIGQIP